LPEFDYLAYPFTPGSVLFQRPPVSASAGFPARAGSPSRQGYRRMPAAV